MTKKSYSERKQLISEQAREIKRYRRIAEERQQTIEMLTESKDQINCSFCRRGTSAGFWFNYCPMCGRKLVEAQHDTRTD